MFYIFTITALSLLINKLTILSAYAQQSIFNGTSFFSNFSLKNIVDIGISFTGGVLIPLFIAILMLFFVINIVAYIRSLESGGTEIIEKTKSKLIYPVFAMAILFLLWGIVYMIRIFFGG